MALNRGNLGLTQAVQASQTSAVYTVGSGQTAYIKGILLHNLSDSGIQNTKIYVVPNAGSANTTTQVARLGIGTDDTFFFEPAYPITLTTNGDTLQVANEGSTNFALNVIVLGDKEI
jgi:hypothetical protein